MPFCPEKTPQRFVSTAVVVAVVLVLHMALLFLAVAPNKKSSQDFPVQYIDNPNAVAVHTMARVRNESVALSSHATLATSLSAYNDLPAAQLLVALRKSSERNSSFAYPQEKGNECLVQLTVDEHNQGTMAYTMMRMVGAREPAPMELRLRLNEYEALHELAHCRQAQLGYPFALAGLTAVENARLAQALANGGTSPLAALFRELYADAYAMHRFMAIRGHSQQALKDMQLLLVWRLANTQENLSARLNGSPASLAKPVQVQLEHAHHATAPLVAAVLQERHTFSAMTPEDAAMQYASRFLVQTTLLAKDKDIANAVFMTRAPNQSPTDMLEAQRAWSRALDLASEFSGPPAPGYWPAATRASMGAAMATRGWAAPLN